MENKKTFADELREKCEYPSLDTAIYRLKQFVGILFDKGHGSSFQDNAFRVTIGNFQEPCYNISDDTPIYRGTARHVGYIMRIYLPKGDYTLADIRDWLAANGFCVGTLDGSSLEFHFYTQK